MSKVWAVLFDFDGTLAEVGIDFAQMRREILVLGSGFGVAVEELRSPYVLELVEEAAGILAQQGGDSAGQFREKSNQIMEEIEMSAAQKCELFSWVKDMLLELGKLKMRTAIVTRNCRRAVEKITGGALGLFDVVITRDEIKRVKPHPDHLRVALSALQQIDRTSKQENDSGDELRGVMVGDHPMDMLCGKRAGLCAVGVLTGSADEEKLLEAGADFVLENASKLPPLMKKLKAES